MNACRIDASYDEISMQLKACDQISFTNPPEMFDPVIFERNERYRRVIRTQPHDIIRAALREAPPGEAELVLWVMDAPTTDVLRVVFEESERIGYSDEDYRSFLNGINRFMFGDGAMGRVALEFARRHPFPPGRDTLRGGERSKRSSGIRLFPARISTHGSWRVSRCSADLGPSLSSST